MAVSPRVAYVTHAGTDDPDPDIPLAVPALSAVGMDVAVVLWDADGVAWEDFDLVLIRSPWDYLDRRQEFLRWARAVEDKTRLANPARTLVRNSDKTYLRDLAKAGVPIIPTVWWEPGDTPAEVSARVGAAGWSRFVVKPSIGSSARGVTIAETPAAAVAAAEALVRAGNSALIQPYLDIVEQGAEVSVIVLAGEVSHAVSRIPPLTEGGPGDARGPVEVSEELAKFALRTVSRVADGDDLLYARVDVVPDPDGQWLVMEVEVTEPCLFLAEAPAGATRLAWAVREMLSSTAGAS